ncbi:MAG: glutathione S-transferase C-terminal domain-containing protein [Myxococcota bacterium]
MTEQEHLFRLTQDPDATPHPIRKTIRDAGDAREQDAYARLYEDVFDQLDALDGRLAEQRFLSGDTEPSAADWALYVVLLRFDPIYYGLFKLNRDRLQDFPQLGDWLRDLYQRPGISETLDLTAAVKDAYISRPDLNPKQTWPVGLPDYDAPHRRGRFDRTALRASGTEESGKGTRKGAFVRGKRQHRGGISPDQAEPGRYHLIVADNCPWCHRCTLTRAILGLQDVISMDTLYFRRDPDRGWQFRPDIEGFDADSLHGVRFVRELYERIGSTEKSVPILWDKREDTLVNNESAEIIRMMDRSFRTFAHAPSLTPADLLDEIDWYNDWIWRDINNGSYKAGFSSNQMVYQGAFQRFFNALDRLERIFAQRQFLCGDRMTEADVRLFPTLFRLDAVYYTRFKLNRTMVKDTVHLKRWFAEMLEVPGVMEASNLERCKQGYFGRHGNEIVPIGPADR